MTRYRDPPGTVKQCSKCGADIMWLSLVRKDGKVGAHPIDAAPVGKRIVRFGREGAKAKIVDTYESHFSTCPNADDFRGRPKARPTTRKSETKHETTDSE